MQNFSGAIIISDMDDFIRPSQECIKPVQVEKKKAADGSKRIHRRIEIDQESGAVSEISSDDKKEEEKIQLKKVEITLADCLACSGCVTSAESFLVNQQSVDEVVQRLKSRSKTPSCHKQLFVASISSQTYVSYAARLGLSLNEVARRLSAAFRKCGFDLIFDVGMARTVALLASCEEFVENYEKSQGVSSIFASSCPGWICFAEKTCGDYILPFISRVKSPQQIMGLVVKDFIAKKYDIAPQDVYHLSVMPCYDKKLEASRSEFTIDTDSDCRQVDSVLTSGEIEQLFEKMDVNFGTSCSDESSFDAYDPEQGTNVKYDHPISHFGSGSGGYAEHIFRYALWKLFSKAIADAENCEVSVKKLRNDDMLEVIFTIFHPMLADC